METYLSALERLPIGEAACGELPIFICWLRATSLHWRDCLLRATCLHSRGCLLGAVENYFPALERLLVESYLSALERLLVETYTYLHWRGFLLRPTSICIGEVAC